MSRFKLHKKIYIGDSLLDKNINGLLWKIRFYPKKARFFLILLSDNPSDQLDIIHSKYLASPLYRNRNLFVVGIATTHEEAVELVCKIAQECVAETGTAYLKQFLEGETS